MRGWAGWRGAMGVRAKLGRAGLTGRQLARDGDTHIPTQVQLLAEMPAELPAQESGGRESRGPIPAGVFLRGAALWGETPGATQEGRGHWRRVWSPWDTSHLLAAGAEDGPRLPFVTSGIPRTPESPATPDGDPGAPTQ